MVWPVHPIFRIRLDGSVTVVSWPLTLYAKLVV
jgi:hypothetical protein